MSTGAGESSDDDLVTLSVPVGVASQYAVPVAAPPDDAQAVAMEVALALPDHLAHSASLMLDEKWLTVETAPTGEDSLPWRMLQIFGATDEDLAAVRTPGHLILVRAIGKAWWQPYHEWSARAVAAGLAGRFGATRVVDLFTPRVLTVDRAEASLPDEHGDTTLMDWVKIPQSRGDLGYWFTTRGLRRYGLPELQTLDVPGSLTGPWTNALSGIAQRLVDEWQAALEAEDRPSFVEIPAVFSLSEADVARAYGLKPRGGGRARVRLRLDPAPDPESEVFLTVLPPDDFPLSAGEFIASVCNALWGAPEPDIRRRAHDPAMQAAIETARAALPRARELLGAHAVDLSARLIVKHRLPIEGGGNEFVWATITDWSSPDVLVGTSMNDAESDPSVRVGRPVRLAADDVVDWALWTDDDGVIEGGWTIRVAEEG